MIIEDVVKSENVDFSGIPTNCYLLGLISAFENRFQAMADRQMKEISWKQFFAIICINFCKKAPTLKELSDILGSSHQNVKQILLKLEAKGFIRFEPDEDDKRKQRICLTQACLDFCNRNDAMNMSVLGAMFDGIPEQDINITIKTLISIEKNLRGVEQ